MLQVVRDERKIETLYTGAWSSDPQKANSILTLFVTGSALTDHEMVDIHYNKIISLQVRVKILPLH